MQNEKQMLLLHLISSKPNTTGICRLFKLNKKVMELQKIYHNGIISLIEFKGLNQRGVYFKNEIGMIKDKKIILYDQDMKQDLKQDVMFEDKEVAYMRMVTVQKKSHLIIALILVATFCLIIFTEFHSLFVPFLVPIFLISVWIILRMRKKYFLQIVLCRAQQKFIRIKKNQITNCKEFVTKYGHYRVSNPEFE